MRSAINFHDLNSTLQVVMGWWGSYLHLFQYGKLLLTDAKTLADWGEEDLLDTPCLSTLFLHGHLALVYQRGFSHSSKVVGTYCFENKIAAYCTRHILATRFHA